MMIDLCANFDMLLWNQTKLRAGHESAKTDPNGQTVFLLYPLNFVRCGGGNTTPNSPQNGQETEEIIPENEKGGGGVTRYPVSAFAVHC